MKVALVTSWGTHCGIAEHSKMLATAVQALDTSIQYCVDPRWLDPPYGDAPDADLVHLNYHRGLHSRWTPAGVAAVRHPVVITFHDTYAVQPDRLPWDLLDCPNVKGMVVHEPCDLLEHPKVRYWRQACPPRSNYQPVAPDTGLPILGTLGFDFPWKNYQELARHTRAAGWGLRIVGEVSPEARGVIQTLNPDTVFDGYQPTYVAVATLASCAATAFMYTCQNSGTSGAIRLGIAAGRKVYALESCRQFRDLMQEEAITWVPSLGTLQEALETQEYGGDVPAVQALAQRLSWGRLASQYVQLYEEAVRG